MIVYISNKMACPVKGSILAGVFSGKRRLQFIRAWLLGILLLSGTER